MILEHGSTEDDMLNSIEISQKKYMEPSDKVEEEEEVNTSDSSTSESSTRMNTYSTNTNNTCRRKKKQKSIVNREESAIFNSNGSENENNKQSSNFDDSGEDDSSSSEKDVNKNVKNKDASTKKTQSSNGHASRQKVDTVKSPEEFQKYVVERLEKITILTEQNNVCINRLLQSMSTLINPTSKPDGLPELPLKSDDEFNQLEELLREKVDAQGQKTSSPAYTYLVRFKIIIMSIFIIYK